MLKFGVIVFPGSNCDHDCYSMVKHVLGHECEFIWHEDKDLSGFDCVILPGGFSYGDYLRTGSIASLSSIMKAVQEFAENGGPVIGICNGFQVLLESGLLPGSLIKNSSLKFVCKWTYVRVENTDTPFTKYLNIGDVLKIPVAHGEGNYFCSKEDLKNLEEGAEIVFRYCDENGEITPRSNPNGSVGNIAGICNKRGNILGMMPHPERCSEELLGGINGVLIFESLINHLRSPANIAKNG